MRRFYTEVTVAPGAAGHALLLDGRDVRTPARAALVVPSALLAERMAEEWRAQGDKVDPRSMPLTGLANAAIDRIGPDPAAFAAGLAAYGESDLLCYRADAPAGLVDRQHARWEPLLDWARRRYDVAFEVVTGVTHRPQPPATVDRLKRAVAAQSPFHLAGLSPLVTVSGSLVLALALLEQAVELEEAWAAASLDEQWQLDQWGTDAEAEAALAARRRDFEAGATFLSLLA